MEIGLDPPGHVLIGSVKDPPQSGKIGEPFIDRIRLDHRRMAPGNVKHTLGIEAVRFIIAGQNDQLGTLPHSLVQGNAARDAKGLGLVTGTSDNAPFLACHDRFSS